jgi:hypothetical protein
VDIVPSTGESGGVLEVRADRRSSSVSRVEIVSFCSDGDVRASHPNITEYSEYFIPE